MTANVKVDQLKRVVLALVSVRLKRLLHHSALLTARAYWYFRRRKKVSVVKKLQEAAHYPLHIDATYRLTLSLYVVLLMRAGPCMSK